MYVAYEEIGSEWVIWGQGATETLARQAASNLSTSYHMETIYPEYFRICQTDLIYPRFPFSVDNLNKLNSVAWFQRAFDESTYFPWESNPQSQFEETLADRLDEFKECLTQDAMSGRMEELKSWAESLKEETQQEAKAIFDLSAEEMEVIRKMRAEKEAEKTKEKIALSILEGAVEYGKWLQENKMESTYSTFVNDFWGGNYDGELIECSIFYDFVNSIRCKAKELAEIASNLAKRN